MTPSTDQMRFVDYVRSHKHTPSQVRMKFTTLPVSQRFGALLFAFVDSNHYGDQQDCGKLLAEFMPDWEFSLNELLALIAPTWNLSVEELPFYLADVFGPQNVVDTATAMAEDDSNGAYERRSFGTIAWWLKHRVQEGW